jgi:hypothetical protein
MFYGNNSEERNPFSRGFIGSRRRFFGPVIIDRRIGPWGLAAAEGIFFVGKIRVIVFE